MWFQDGFSMAFSLLSISGPPSTSISQKQFDFETWDFHQLWGVRCLRCKTAMKTPCKRAARRPMSPRQTNFVTMVPFPPLCSHSDIVFFLVCGWRTQGVSAKRFQNYANSIGVGRASVVMGPSSKPMPFGVKNTKLRLVYKARHLSQTKQDKHMRTGFPKKASVCGVLADFCAGFDAIKEYFPEVWNGSCEGLVCRGKSFGCCDMSRKTSKQKWPSRGTTVSLFFSELTKISKECFRYPVAKQWWVPMLEKLWLWTHFIWTCLHQSVSLVVRKKLKVQHVCMSFHCWPS